jgi:hypothetical protein
MLLLGAGALAGCGGSNDQAANQVAKAPAKKKAGYCFFKEPDTKAWAAKRGKDGNVVVTGKAYRQDGRYMAVLGPPTVAGSTAELSPTVTTNNTGNSMEDGWWDVTAIIPNSVAVTSVTVSCGPRTLATIALPPPKS